MTQDKRVSDTIEPMYNDGPAVPRQEYLAENIELLSNSKGGKIVCPACGEPIASIDAEHGFDGFETICANCDVALFLSNVVVLTDGLVTERNKERAWTDQTDNPTVTLDELRDHVTEKWEAELSEGITQEVWRPGENKVMDFTSSIASEMSHWADEFGWDWKPPEHLFEEGEEGDG